MMVGTRRAEEVIDPNLEVKPTTRSLKRALLVALRCVDPDSEKRPKMGQVVRMLDADEFPFRQVSTVNSLKKFFYFPNLSHCCGISPSKGYPTNFKQNFTG